MNKPFGPVQGTQDKLILKGSADPLEFKRLSQEMNNFFCRFKIQISAFYIFADGFKLFWCLPVVMEKK
jgi:hypothetical protein